MGVGAMAQAANETIFQREAEQSHLNPTPALCSQIDPAPQPQPQQQQQQQQPKKPQQKEMTKAERRALQEAQRAAKAASKAVAQEGTGGGKLKKTSSSTSLSRNVSDKENSRGMIAHQTSSGTIASASQGMAPSAHGTPSAPPPNKATALFAHLPQYKSVSVETVSEHAARAGVPLQCVRLGFEMAQGRVRGTNARCAAMLDMFCEVFREFKVSKGKFYAREIGSVLNTMVSFLVSCRPLSPAMGNAVKAVKAELGRIIAATNPSISDSEAREQLVRFIGTFVQEKVRFATTSLAREAAAKIIDGDVVLTYAHSSTVEAVLYAAAAAGRRFSVVIVDARPLLEGRTLLRRLLSAGIPCDYVLLNGLEIGLSQATKVALGAAAVMSNGAVLSRVGTAAVAMAAAAAHVPVMVCAETYKFHERVQLDCITYNELGNPEGLLEGAGGDAAALRSDWATNDNMSLLNLMYDATPGEFVTAIMTEVGSLPSTSVPVVLREYRISQE